VGFEIGYVIVEKNNRHHRAGLGAKLAEFEPIRPLIQAR
jgi:hypothetical protein